MILDVINNITQWETNADFQNKCLRITAHHQLSITCRCGHGPAQGTETVHESYSTIALIRRRKYTRSLLTTLKELFKDVGDPPIFFYICDITKPSSYTGKSLGKKSMLENFRANVFKRTLTFISFLS